MRPRLSSLPTVLMPDAFKAPLILGLGAFTVAALYTETSWMAVLALLLIGKPMSTVYGAWVCLLCAYSAGWASAHCVDKAEGITGSRFNGDDALERVPTLVVVLILAGSWWFNVQTPLSIERSFAALPPALLAAGTAFLCIYQPWTSSRELVQANRNAKRKRFWRYRVERSTDGVIWEVHPDISPPSGFFETPSAAYDATQGTDDGARLRVVAEVGYTEVVIG